MAWQLGLHEGKRARVEERKCKKIDCNNLFKVKYFDPKQFCSQSCAAVVNNTGQRRRKVTNCLNCGKETPRSTYKYCCNSCQMKYQHNSYVKKWSAGEIRGLTVIGTVSPQIKRYLRDKYNNKCCLCGWSEVNPTTGTVPLTADHVDGNWKNNKEGNLRLLCPNCDSLTPTYKNLNRGNGRETRMQRIRLKSKAQAYWKIRGKLIK